MCGRLLRAPHRTWPTAQACALTGNRTRALQSTEPHQPERVSYFHSLSSRVLNPGDPKYLSVLNLPRSHKWSIFIFRNIHLREDALNRGAWEREPVLRGARSHGWGGPFLLGSPSRERGHAHSPLRSEAGPPGDGDRCALAGSSSSEEEEGGRDAITVPLKVTKTKHCEV